MMNKANMIKAAYHYGATERQRDNAPFHEREACQARVAEAWNTLWDLARGESDDFWVRVLARFRTYGYEGEPLNDDGRAALAGSTER